MGLVAENAAAAAENKGSERNGCHYVSNCFFFGSGRPVAVAAIRAASLSARDAHADEPRSPAVFYDKETTTLL